MSTYPKMKREDNGPDLYACGNCAKEWSFKQLDDVTDITERVSSGEAMPAGQCPDCHALCHAVKHAQWQGELWQGPRVDPNPEVNWRNDAIQFPRLLAEIAACVRLTQRMWEDLSATTDLTRDQLEDIFDRATTTWDDIKSRTGKEPRS